MKKSSVKRILYLILTFTLMLSVLIIHNLKEKENTFERISDLPDLNVSSLDGELINIGNILDDKPLMIYYYNTQCIFCQGTIEDLPNHTNLIDKASILFISDEHPAMVKKFISDFEVKKDNNLFFLNDSKKQVKEFFSIRAVPAIYLYDRDGKLIQLYRGAIGLEEVSSQLQINDLPN